MANELGINGVGRRKMWYDNLQMPSPEELKRRIAENEAHHERVINAVKAMENKYPEFAGYKWETILELASMNQEERDTLKNIIADLSDLLSSSV